MRWDPEVGLGRAEARETSRHRTGKVLANPRFLFCLLHILKPQRPAALGICVSKVVRVTVFVVEHHLLAKCVDMRAVPRSCRMGIVFASVSLPLARMQQYCASNGYHPPCKASSILVHEADRGKQRHGWSSSKPRGLSSLLSS